MANFLEGSVSAIEFNELLWRSKAMAERLLADPYVSDEIKESARRVLAMHLKLLPPSP